MNRTKLLGVILVLMLSGNAFGQQRLSVYDSILHAVRQEQIHSVRNFSSLNKNVAAYLANDMYNSSTGSWRDVDYKETVRTNASWVKALNRLKQMSLAYTIKNAKNKYYQSEKLYDAINKSLHYFCSLQPIPYSTNWYYQGVTRPQSLALILINMRYGKVRLNKTVEQIATNVMCKDTAYTDRGRNNPLQPVNQGSNRSLIAMDWLYIGALIKSDYMLKVGSQESFSPIKYTTGEGIQRDLSYNMHYGYLYIGSYGTDFMSSVIKAASYTAGTRYAIKKKQLHLFRRFVLETVVGTIRGHWIDWNVVGRGISRRGTIARNYSELLKKMQQIDKDSASLYTPIIKRMEGVKPVSFGVQASHRHYWTTDYTLHIRPAYTFAIHAISSRTKSTEIGNQENLKGFWAAEGATAIQTKGDEYFNIFPLWNWTKIPGTTLPDTLPPTNGGEAPGGGDRRGASDFSGGVSDSLYGATAYVMNNDVLTSAKKAWFQFGDEVVCLGAGIFSDAKQPVYTTVNQTLLRRNKLLISTNDGVKKISGFVDKQFDNNLKWVVQDDVGYVFPKKGNIELQTENRKSNWLPITKSGAENATAMEDKNVFQLSFDHGVKPRNKNYAYIIVPDIHSKKAMKRYVANDNISIKNNSDSLQVVYHKALKQWQMVFYKANVAFQNDSIRLWTSHPAILMMQKNADGGYLVHIAEPTHKYKTIVLYMKCPNVDSLQKISIDLPKGVYAGKSVELNINPLK